MYWTPSPLVSPLAISSGVRLFAWKLWPVYPRKLEPLKLLPPSLGIRLMNRPPPDTSAPGDDVWTVTSWVIESLWFGCVSPLEYVEFIDMPSTDTVLSAAAAP